MYKAAEQDTNHIRIFNMPSKLLQYVKHGKQKCTDNIDFTNLTCAEVTVHLLYIYIDCMADWTCTVDSLLCLGSMDVHKEYNVHKNISSIAVTVIYINTLTSAHIQTIIYKQWIQYTYHLNRALINKANRKV